MLSMSQKMSNSNDLQQELDICAKSDQPVKSYSAYCSKVVGERLGKQLSHT